MRLADAIGALDTKSFDRLCRRHGVQLDERKRLSPAEQVARQVAERAVDAVLGALPDAAQEVAELLLREPQGVRRLDLGGGVLPLIEQDLVFPVPGAHERVAIPDAYRLQASPAVGEDLESARALLCRLDLDTRHALASHVLGRRPHGPWPLWLEPVLVRLEQPTMLEAQLAELSSEQRRLLGAVEARGGRLPTDEILALERTPARIEQAGGSILPPRSSAHSLMLRGLLLSRARGVWTLPSEVAAVVGRPRREAEREQRKRLLRRIAEEEDFAPHRAEPGIDCGPRVVAAMLCLRRAGGLHAGRAVRRSTLKQLSRDLSLEVDTTTFLVAVARAHWTALERVSLVETGRVMMDGWRRGSAWDEARVESDTLRQPDAVSRAVTPTRQMREVLIDFLMAVSPDRFAPWDELLPVALADPRLRGVQATLRRAAQRHAGRIEVQPEDVLLRIRASLIHLGALDRVAGPPELVRLSANGRRWAEAKSRPPRRKTHWEGTRLVVGDRLGVRDVVSAAWGAEPIPTAEGLQLRVDESTLSGAIELGIDADELQARFARLEPGADSVLQPAIERAQRRAPTVEAIAASFFLPIPDTQLRGALMELDEASEYFIELHDGLLVRSGVDRKRLRRVLSRAGMRLQDRSDG